MAVTIKIRYTRYYPATGKRWPETAADENVIVQIPNRCLMGAAIVQHVIRSVIAVKIRGAY